MPVSHLGRFSLWHNSCRATKLGKSTLWHNGRQTKPGLMHALDCMFVVIDTYLPRFEALAYVLPHFDELTQVLRSSFNGLVRSDILSS